MNFKKPTAPVLITYSALSICLSTINYFLSYLLGYNLGNLSLNTFITCLVLLILLQSAYIAKVSGSKLLAIVGTTTIFSWILNYFFFGFYSFFSPAGGLEYYLMNTQTLLEHLELNLLFLVFSILGALIGEKLIKKNSSKKSKK